MFARLTIQAGLFGYTRPFYPQNFVQITISKICSKGIELSYIRICLGKTTIKNNELFNKINPLSCHNQSYEPP